jgi:F-type H+-transporting ATPase subunit gamma
MLNTRQIRRKIRTVRNIQQITQAMKMVAAARLKRVQAKVEAGRVYWNKMQEIVERVAPLAGQVEHPLLAVREPARSVLVLTVGGEKGLCGSYNVNVIRKTAAFVAEQSAPTSLITVGRKALDYFTKHDYTVIDHFSQIGVESDFSDALSVAVRVRGLYESAEVDEVYVAYTRFVSAMTHEPTVMRLLPLAPPAAQAEQHRLVPYEFEPEPQRLLARLLPRYVDTQIYHLLLEAAASEYGARMVAMTNATDNAADMIESLTLRYNKARQAAITKELLEVVTGADALTRG